MSSLGADKDPNQVYWYGIGLKLVCFCWLMSAGGGLSFLDFDAPGFSTRGDEVIEARRHSWCARTRFGLAVLRHRQAGQLLRDKRLRQGSHAWPQIMGLQGAFAEFWQRSVISQEGVRHRQHRMLTLQALSPEFVTSLVPQFENTADALIDAMASKSAIEFIEDFSHPFAGRAVSTLLDLPEVEAEWIAEDAARLGLAMRLDCKAFEPEFNAACERLTELAQSLLDRAQRQRRRRRQEMSQGENFVSRLLGGLTDFPTDQQALIDLIVISIFGGVDTTRAQLGFIMALFAEHADQWRLLRANPELVPKAIEESLRARPTTTWSTREAVESFEFEGVEIQQGETIHILAHATATDPTAVPDWSFDITAERKIHFGFGGGAHHCLGQFVARTDMAAALRCLARRVAEIEFDGEPAWEPDSGNTAPKSLPLRFKWA